MYLKLLTYSHYIKTPRFVRSIITDTGNPKRALVRTQAGDTQENQMTIDLSLYKHKTQETVGQKSP